MPSRRIAIIGCGPIGLEAALYARTLGHEVRVFERGEIAVGVAAWGHVRLFSTWAMNSTPLGRKTLAGVVPPLALDQCPTGRELREQYLLPLAESPLLKGIICERTEVKGVVPGESGYRLELMGPEGAQTASAEIVLDCSGLWDRQRFSGREGKFAPGEERLKERIHYMIPDVLGRQRELFAGRHTLLLGYNYMVAIALRDLQQLADVHPRTAVTWAIRQPGQPVHPAIKDAVPERARLTETMLRLIERPPGWLHFMTIAAVESISADAKVFTVGLRSNGRLACVLADQIISLTGHRPAAREEITPNRYVVGSRTLDPRRSPNSALAEGHRQIQQAFAAIHQDSDLSLY